MGETVRAGVLRRRRRHARMGPVIDAYTAADVRGAEQPLLAAERGFAGGLMHRAATALAGVVREELKARGTAVAEASVVALVGRGNNGGDALHALAALAGRGASATAVALGPAHEGGLAALTAAGGRVLAVADGAPGEPVWLGDAVAEAFAADVLLDGLLGIGARGGLREPAAGLVELLDGLLAEAGAGAPTVVAVDVPSGIGVDDGTVPGPVLAADRTVTFGVPKPGLLLPPAAHLTGDVTVVDLGLRAGLEAQGVVPAVRRLEAADVADLWPVPGPEDHKYRRGVLGVLAGSVAYPGAAVLCVAGAQGAGVGMARYLGPDAVAAGVLAAHPEVVVGDGRVQAWVIGPGLDDGRLGVARERLARRAARGPPRGGGRRGAGGAAGARGGRGARAARGRAGDAAARARRRGGPGRGRGRAAALGPRGARADRGGGAAQGCGHRGRRCRGRRRVGAGRRDAVARDRRRGRRARGRARGAAGGAGGARAR